MILIGMFDSPFVRRVAVSLHLLGMPFEHRAWSVGKDFDRIREFNPLGRVPTLVLDSGESLMESAAILDYVDSWVGAERALLPAAAAARTDALRLMAVAVGAAEKGVTQIYESAFRPPEKRHQPWVDRCRVQMLGALDFLELHAAARAGQWLVGERLTQADITVACVFTFLCEAAAAKRTPADYPALEFAVARCEAMPAFRAARLAFEAPRGAG
jgi:glutathione S-transferase